jgi:hypothetical protein
MVCFQTQNPNFGKFWRALQWKMLVYFITIWSSLRTFGIIIWYNLKFYREKSGNPGNPGPGFIFRASSHFILDLDQAIKAKKISDGTFVVLSYSCVTRKPRRLKRRRLLLLLA